MNCPVCGLAAIPQGAGFFVCRVRGHMPTRDEVINAAIERDLTAGRWFEPGRWPAGEPGEQGKHQTRTEYMRECGFITREDR